VSDDGGRYSFAHVCGRAQAVNVKRTPGKRETSSPSHRGAVSQVRSPPVAVT